MDKAKHRRVIEWVKTFVIVLLVVSALLLGVQTGQFDELIGAIPFFGSVARFMSSNQPGSESPASSIIEAARPHVIVITDDEGARCGVKYDTVLRNEVYDRMSIIVSEALGSVSEPVEISQAQWRTALSRTGVYFEYAIPVKLSILYGWLGARMPENINDVSLKRMLVTFGDERNRVYYYDMDNDLYFGADTASTAGRTQEQMMPDAAYEIQFAFETDLAAGLTAPDTVLFKGNSTHPDIQATAAGSAEQLMDLIIEAVGHSYDSYSFYSIDGGTLVCVGTQFRIRADAQGFVFYRRTDGYPTLTNETQTYSEGESIERARLVVSETIGKVSGNAVVFFESIETISENIHIVNFNYCIAGGRVFLRENNYAARITIMSGVVIEAELNYKSYSLTDETTRLLPEPQAFAAAGGDFTLSYADIGAEVIPPFWGRGE